MSSAVRSCVHIFPPSGRLTQVFPLVGHYAFFLAVFGPLTMLKAVLFGGMLMAFIVTSSHQSEELFVEHEPDWVRAQFLSTRDAEPGNPFSAWLWGGMQHQVEHHLFPTMPRYKYTALARAALQVPPASTPQPSSRKYPLPSSSLTGRLPPRPARFRRFR